MDGNNLKTLQYLNDILETGRPSIFYFYSEGNDQCKMMDGVVKELASIFTNVLFWRIDAQNFSDISLRFSVKVVPSFVLNDSNGNITSRIEGAKPGELATAIQTLSVPEDLDSKCDRLINAHPIVLFIKGTPDAPRCGFTVQLLNLLKSNGISSFKHYNILDDEPLRQHLKLRSQWPTYPQVYVKGELIGGLDILKEMQASGELAKIASELK